MSESQAPIRALTAAYNGGTHMPFEDMGILRSIPHITLIEPTDTVMLRDIVTQLKDLYGVFYIRLLRGNAIGIYKDGTKFDISKGVILREGADVTIFSSGIMVAESLKACDILKAEGINSRIVNLFCWKPVDEMLIDRCAAETGAIVTRRKTTMW